MRRASLMLLLTACGDNAAVPDDATAPDATAPTTLRAEASATITVGDERVECVVGLDLQSIVVEGAGLTAEGFGEVFRRSFRGDAILFEFSALVAGPVSVVASDAGVEARLVGDQPDDAMPFWTALEVLAGASSGTLTYAGAWTCAPILPGDPDTEDLELDAPGTWTIAPPQDRRRP